MTSRDRELEELRRAVAARDVEIDVRRRRMDYKEQELATLRSELAAAQAVRQRVTWKVSERVGDSVVAILGGRDSLPTRFLRRALLVAARLRSVGQLGALQAAEAPAPIELPEFEAPEVSLVVRVFSGAELTRACLESIRDQTSKASYEVIVVDDAADRATKDLFAGVQGARIVVNETNLGYLRSVNRGAGTARGKWIVLCNNDIQAMDGWLTAMLNCGESSDDIAVVTPKYLYPDLSLNEAGGIIWRDATGRNYGRGDSPGDYQYEFRREVDYGSAAALMVRRKFSEQAGGFDERFLPMYYEDTDLCFQARELGHRVMYEPRANVVHLEGGTAGTEISEGHKRFQELNRATFLAKWGDRLEAEQLNEDSATPRLASDRHRGPHVLIVDHRVPMWDRDAGSLRMRGMIDALLALGCRVTLCPEDRYLFVPYTLELQRLGVEVIYGEDVSISEELTATGPGLSLVITSRPHTSSRWLDLIRECAPTAPVVYDTVDLHWLRESRRSAIGDGVEAIAHGSRAAALRELELALIRASDATLVVSHEERERVRSEVPTASVWVAPNIHTIRSVVAPPESRAGVLFVGGFEHLPNTEAVLRLVRGVMPLVWKELGQVTVSIVGGSPPRAVRALASPPSG